MREPCCLWLSAADRARLAALAADRNSPQKHVWRASIVLLSVDRLGTVEIMRRTGKAKPSVWRWQARYLEAGVDGLLRDKTAAGAHSPAGDRPGRAGGRPHARAAAGRGDPLDGARHGARRRDLAGLGAADLGGARPAAAPGADVQAVQRPGVRRQAARRDRPLCRPAGACGSALGRREVPDPGARPHPAGAADRKAGPGR